MLSPIGAHTRVAFAAIISKVYAATGNTGWGQFCTVCLFLPYFVPSIAQLLRSSDARTTTLLLGTAMYTDVQLSCPGVASLRSM